MCITCMRVELSSVIHTYLHACIHAVIYAYLHALRLSLNIRSGGLAHTKQTYKCIICISAQRSTKCHKMVSHASKFGLSGINKHVLYTKNTFLMSIRVGNITFDRFLKTFEKVLAKKQSNTFFSRSSTNNFELVDKNQNLDFLLFFFPPPRSASTVLCLEWARDTMTIDYAAHQDIQLLGREGLQLSTLEAKWLDELYCALLAVYLTQTCNFYF